MRLSWPPLVLVGATLLIAFSEFSLPAIVVISSGSVILLLGHILSRRAVGVIGFFILALGAVETAEFPDLTVLPNILAATVFFVIPLAFSLWFALIIGSSSTGQQRANPVPYIWSVLFAAVVLSSVPITGIILNSARLVADVGVESQIMLIGFTTAVWAVALLGVDTKK